MNWSAIAAEKAKISQADWRDACRQARDADERRRSTVRVIWATGASPVGGYGASLGWIRKQKAARTPEAAELLRLATEDQLARDSLSMNRAPAARGLSPLARRIYDLVVSSDAIKADAASRAWLKETVARRGWFTISRDGEDADAAAQLVVQHADEDLTFKGEMIALIEPLVEKGESRRSFFPYLYDRWAAAAHKPLRFGLQGACKGKGLWEPLPTEDPEHLEDRRQTFGLESFALQQNRENARCS